jgi:hypothetical protein
MHATRGLARRLFGCVLASIAVSACGTGPSPLPAATSSMSATGHFAGEGLSFEYPGTWGDASFDVESSFSHVLVFLSTAPLSDPCDRTANSFACIRNPVTALGPDGVLVEWSRQSFPGWTFDPTRGRLTTVGGRQATLEQSVPLEGPCQEIGGERELVVTIADPTPDMNWTGMRACLRGPSLDSLQAQVEAMLASVTWSE